MATLEQILNHRNLTGVIRAVKSGIPQPLPAEFFRVNRRVSGNKAEYFKISGNRQVARIAQYGSPAQRREMRGIDSVPITLLHSFESQQWPLAMTINLTKMTDLSQDSMGEQQAEFQTAEFKKLFSNLRIVSALMALFKGIIYVDGKGNILPTSTGAAYSIDFGVPANNKNQLNGLISTSWDNASSDIITQLLKLRTHALKLTGYEITHAFYGDEIPELIAKNTLAQAYLARNPGMNQSFINTPTVVPPGFGGIRNWIYAGNTFFADKDGTNQTLLAADGIVFTPDHDFDWFEVIEGSFPVPTTVIPQMGSDARAMLANVSEQYGMFSYGQLTLNPPSVEQFAGDTWLPTLKVPEAIFQADVKF